MNKRPMLYFVLYNYDISKWKPIMHELSEHGYLVRWWSRSAKKSGTKNNMPNQTGDIGEWDNWTLLTDDVNEVSPTRWFMPYKVAIVLNEHEWGVE